MTPPVRQEIASRLLYGAAAVLVALALSGCAATVRPVALGSSFQARSAADANLGWWYARYRIYWPEGQDPVWPADLMIAHRIVAPVLFRHQAEIPLWRFHRRAARDEAGHQFSFIIYCTPQTARKVFSDLRASETLADMKHAGWVEKDLYDDTSQLTRPALDGVSDKSWPPEVRNSWPWFIMGVGRTWLELIDGFANDGRPKPMTVYDAAPFYGEIDMQVRQAWAVEGAHAYLHHLNAVFGYGPLNLRGKETAF